MTERLSLARKACRDYDLLRSSAFWKECRTLDRLADLKMCDNAALHSKRDRVDVARVGGGRLRLTALRS